MHVPLTLAVLALLTLPLLWLRFRWPRLSPRARRAVILVPCVIVALKLLSIVTAWTFSSFLLHTLHFWLLTLSYILLLLLFTRLRPRWLTTTAALILAVPIFSASIFLPLTALFDTAPHITRKLDDSYLSELSPWSTANGGATGNDLDIYYQPHWLPFLRHRAGGGRLYDEQCDTAAATAQLDLPDKTATIFCPARPSTGPSADAPETPHQFLVPLH